MDIAPHGPADTRNMGIVHSALRRDLVRCRILLNHLRLPHRSRLLGEHLVWMMGNLHHHHHGEDEHLWPELRRRDPSIETLLVRMDADHRLIQQPMSDLETAGRQMAAGNASAPPVEAAIDALEAALLPHLAAEETDAMVEVSRLLTQREMGRLEFRAWARGQAPREGAFAVNYVLDNATPTARERFVHDFPAPLRFLLLTALKGRYLRHREALWGGTPALDVPPLSAEARRDW